MCVCRLDCDLRDKELWASADWIVICVDKEIRASADWIVIYGDKEFCVSADWIVIYGERESGQDLAGACGLSGFEEARDRFI